MKKRSNKDEQWDELRDKIIGLGEHSTRKSYYPELQTRLEELEREIRSRDVLLKELFHRTRNNMQVIKSLLALQSANIDDPTAKQLLKEMESRILSMALVHEKLYRSKDLTFIDFKDYLTDLVHALYSEKKEMQGRVTMELECEPVSLSIDTTTPCGLVINELMMNAMKHAFTGRDRGIIQIVCRHLPDNKLELIFKDDGVGLPAGFEISKSRTLGLKLVQSLVTQQLRGTLDIRSQGGTEFRAVFPIPDPTVVRRGLPG